MIFMCNQKNASKSKKLISCIISIEEEECFKIITFLKSKHTETVLEHKIVVFDSDHKLPVRRLDMEMMGQMRS